MRTWLILDCNYLAYRAFYTTGGMTHHEEPTGVVFGILRGLNTFSEKFGTDDFVLTFDHGKGLREQAFSWYKEERRKKRIQEEQEGPLQEMREQVTRLRTDYLERIGHHNIFYKKGFEADDIIAQVVAGLPRGDSAIMISGDEDLLQLLSKNVSFYSPRTKEYVTNASFREKYNIHPSEWPMVKAIAGCESDEIDGLEGVGEVLAAKYLAGDMPKTYKVYPRIRDYMASQSYRDNLSLVTLPYTGTAERVPVYRPVPDGPRNADAWRELAEELGMATLANALEPDRRWRSAELSNAP